MNVKAAAAAWIAGFAAVNFNAWNDCAKTLEDKVPLPFMRQGWWASHGKMGFIGGLDWEGFRCSKKKQTIGHKLPGCIFALISGTHWFSMMAVAQPPCVFLEKKSSWPPPKSLKPRASFTFCSIFTFCWKHSFQTQTETFWHLFWQLHPWHCSGSVPHRPVMVAALQAALALPLRVRMMSPQQKRRRDLRALIQWGICPGISYNLWMQRNQASYPTYVHRVCCVLFFIGILL